MNPSDSRRRKRQILLFLSAILIPSAVLITLAIRVVRQETELAEKRVAEERRDALEQLRRELSARLEAIKLQEVNRLIAESDYPPPPRSSDSPIVFTAPLDQDRLVFPWNEERIVPPPSIQFSEYRMEGEAREFLGNDVAGALDTYSQALASARTPLEECEARLWVGRVLVKAGKMKEASDVYHAMLKECDALTDDDGVSFGLYAAERLISMELDPGGAREYVINSGRPTRWRSPVQIYLMRSLLSGLVGLDADAARMDLSSEIHDSEQIIALANDLHRLGRPFHTGAGPGWLAYGDEPWLITIISAAPFAPAVVLAVSSKKVSPPDARFLPAHSSQGFPLGEGFADLHVEWMPGRFPMPNAMPPALYATGIALILGVTMLAGYLLLRDVSREVQVAEMRSLFVASVSHELKTPLTAIRMFAETLAMGRDGNERTRSEYLQTIVNESERLSRLVDNVLDFARIERGKKIYQLQPVFLADVVRSAAQAIQYPLAQQGFALIVSIDENLPSLTADADAMEQAILNLLANAMKYSGDSRQIELHLRRLDEEAVIEVIDRGIGIRKEDQPRIFEKFYRVRSTETDRVPGAGLGLTLAMHAVKAHGGCLEVSSEVGRGSTFSVRLPFKTKEAEA